MHASWSWAGHEHGHERERDGIWALRCSLGSFVYFVVARKASHVARSCLAVKQRAHRKRKRTGARLLAVMAAPGARSSPLRARSEPAQSPPAAPAAPAAAQPRRLNASRPGWRAGSLRVPSEHIYADNAPMPQCPNAPMPPNAYNAYNASTVPASRDHLHTALNTWADLFPPQALNRESVALFFWRSTRLSPSSSLCRASRTLTAALPSHTTTSPSYDLISGSVDLLQTAYRSRQLHLALLMRSWRPLARETS
ncbi:hypothetical protein AOQ84DRAFT_226006 [Glonium stellatum]|uniref:Uncharacterized protein n=1 Tax=Glonium stellatum TaxID=574774 RepID=A0A8E2F9S8_9PEZI|nr:hypothetical protein AOQ84DRAFT_226006 [Glonium stellatum]